MSKRKTQLNRQNELEGEVSATKSEDISEGKADEYRDPL